jgi:hypothetical protein
MARRIRKIAVVGVGKPPPPPLVDEVLRARDAKLRTQARPDQSEEAILGRRTDSCARDGGSQPNL